MHFNPCQAQKAKKQLQQLFHPAPVFIPTAATTRDEQSVKDTQ